MKSLIKYVWFLLIVVIYLGCQMQPATSEKPSLLLPDSIPFDSSRLAHFSTPDSSTVWDTGATAMLKWVSDSTLNDYVYLALYSDTNFLLTITGGAILDTGLLSWRVPLNLSSGNQYRIKITDFNFASRFAFSGFFTFRGVTPDTFEWDDSLSSAKPIDTDGGIQSHTIALGDVDWIKFYLEKDSNCIVTALGKAGIVLSLFCETDSNFLKSPSGFNTQIIFKSPESSEYYLKISKNGMADTSEYRLVVRKFSDILPVNFTAPIAQIAWGPGLHEIQWLPDTGLLGTGVQLELLYDSVVVPTGWGWITNDGTFDWDLPLDLPAGNRFRIKIVNGNSFDYSVPKPIFGLSEWFTVNGLAPDPYEPDDSSTVARVIVAGSGTQLRNLGILDEDWFFSTFQKNYVYRIIASEGISPRIDLYMGDGKTPEDSCNTKQEKSNPALFWYCDVSGEYYFKISGPRYGKYNLDFARYDSTQFSYVVTGPWTGYAAALGGSLTVVWQDPVRIGSLVDIYLYNGQGRILTIATNATNSHQWAIPATLSAGNDYFIKVVSQISDNVYGNSGVFSIM